MRLLLLCGSAMIVGLLNIPGSAAVQETKDGEYAGFLEKNDDQ